MGVLADISFAGTLIASAVVFENKQSNDIFSGELSVRSITTEKGKKMYCLTDVARCIGYKAPEKYAARLQIEKTKMPVRWQTGIRTGTTKMYCATAENIIDSQAGIVMSDKFKKWLAQIDKSEMKQSTIEAQSGLVELDEDKPLRDMLDNIMTACYELQDELNKRKEVKVFVIR